VTSARLSRPLLVVTVAAVVRLVFAALIPLLPDEAYYWEWSRRLAPGYFDHPYGVALLIRIGDSLLSPIGLSWKKGFARCLPMSASVLTLPPPAKVI
jgi:hypothetical protein